MRIVSLVRILGGLDSKNLFGPSSTPNRTVLSENPPSAPDAYLDGKLDGLISTRSIAGTFPSQKANHFLGLVVVGIAHGWEKVVCKKSNK